MNQFRNRDFGETIVFVPNIKFSWCYLPVSWQIFVSWQIQLINWWKWIGDSLVIVDLSAHGISDCIYEISAHCIEHVVGSMYSSIQTLGIEVDNISCMKSRQVDRLLIYYQSFFMKPSEKATPLRKQCRY
jgi:hypothetical protein